MYLVALLAALMLSLCAQVAADPSGRWEGRIHIPERVVSLIVDLAGTPEVLWIGSLSTPVSTTIDVPLGNITIEGSVVKFTATLPGRATFEGPPSSDASGLSGTVSNAEATAPFQLARTGAARK